MSFPTPSFIVTFFLFLFTPIILLFVFRISSERKSNLFLSFVLIFLALNLIPIPRPSINNFNFTTGELDCKEPIAIGLGWPTSYLKYYLDEPKFREDFFETTLTTHPCVVSKGQFSLIEGSHFWILSSWGAFAFIFSIYRISLSIFSKSKKR